MKILIVEDNRHLAQNLETYLLEEGNVCAVAFTYHEAVEKVVSFGYDIVILDIMLPDGNGLELMETLRKVNSEAGVLVVSAKDSLDDKIAGLNLGADDYLTKPFHLSELNARIKAIYRRKNLGNHAEIRCQELALYPEARTLTVHDLPVELTQKEYELLLFLLTNQNRVVTKQSIAEYLWGDYVDSLDSFDFVYQHIKNLRKKLLRAGGEDHIRTVYGIGYKFMTAL